MPRRRPHTLIAAAVAVLAVSVGGAPAAARVTAPHADGAAAHAKPAAGKSGKRSCARLRRCRG